ncbi:Protein kinase domain [Macleaya cordata]|uniref:non-specific serine/threonine protein kinase n=1 Tax=Macleaya cordata TaxID=56857 RepID=A0A200Q9T4_MACCD|nr:Protein kinase domain [Macleaya cordata]
MQDDGNLIQYPIETFDTGENAYWNTNTYKSGDNVTLNLNDDGQLYLVKTTTNFNIMNLSRSNGTLPTSGKIFYRVTLDADGIFRLYSHTLIAMEPDCRCLPGFLFINQDQKTQGCRREVSIENCGNKQEQFKFTMYLLDNIEWQDNPYSVLTTATKDECKTACMDDCSCEAAMFYDQECRKQKIPLRYGKSGITTAFVKIGEEISLRSFTYEELENATDGFKEVLGRGSFGTVFKGTLSNSQRLIAVKRLERMVDEGEKEFRTEMRAIGRTHHKNLVQLLGYCHEGLNRLLVYEYMSNGSLANFLFKSERCPGWNERVDIALNVARGILYLHEECETQIIQCDINPQNILMDEYRCAKIADFGLAKLLKPDQTRTFTAIRGTRGYVSPEWHKNLPITIKADVYSFGIVLLEIICCRKSLDMELVEDEVILVDWVCHCFDVGELGKLMTDEEVDIRGFQKMVSLALWCIQDEPSLRPSMKKVVLMMEGIIDIPTLPCSATSFLSSI